MITRPLADLEARLTAVRTALECTVTQLELVARDIRQTFTGLVPDDSPWWDVARACDFQAGVGRRAMAQCEVVDAQPVERDHHSRPVDPAIWSAEEIMRNDG